MATAAASSTAAATTTTAAATAANVAMAISVAATIAQIAQARKQAKATEEANKLRNKQIQEAAIKDYDQLANVELDRQQAANEQSLNVQKNYMANKGRINVAAATYGTAGQSLSSKLSGINRDKLGDFSQILRNRQVEQDDLRVQAQNIQTGVGNSMSPTKIARPSYATAALKIGSQLVSSYEQNQVRNEQAALLSAPKSGV